MTKDRERIEVLFSYICNVGSWLPEIWDGHRRSGGTLPSIFVLITSSPSRNLGTEPVKESLSSTGDPMVLHSVVRLQGVRDQTIDLRGSRQIYRESGDWLKGVGDEVKRGDL